MFLVEMIMKRSNGEVNKTPLLIILGVAIFSAVLAYTINSHSNTSGWQTTKVQSQVLDDNAVQTKDKLTWDEDTQSIDLVKQENIDQNSMPINLVMNEERKQRTASVNDKLTESKHGKPLSASTKTSQVLKSVASQRDYQDTQAISFSASGNSAVFRQEKPADIANLTLVGENNQRYSADLTKSGGIKNFNGLEDGHYRWEVFSTEFGTNTQGTREQSQNGIQIETEGAEHMDSQVTVERGRFEIRNGAIVENISEEEELEEIKERKGSG